MPSGKTHDLVTLVLAIPAAAAVYLYAPRAAPVAVFTAAFIFGGLMFGPDLDTNSRQSARWWILKPIWLPYRVAFGHRSRLTHGLVFGTAIRVIYFAGAVTLGAYMSSLIVNSMTGGSGAGPSLFAESWTALGRYVRERLGLDLVYLALGGIWLGAATHTLADLAFTFVKTGRRSKAL